MRLNEAKRLGEKLRAAEAAFDDSWRRRRNAGMLLAAAFGWIPAMFVARVMAASVGQAPDALLVLGCTGIILGGLWWFAERSRRRIKAQQGMGSMDARVLIRCTTLPALPDEVAEPLERSLDAYRAVSRSADDALWAKAGFPAREMVLRAGEQLLGLMDWGERLAAIADVVTRLRGSPGAEVVGLEPAYRAQLAGLIGAADAFHTAEARMARAHLSLVGNQGAGIDPAAELSGLTASFQAITEVLEPHHAPPTVATEEPAVQRLGR